MGQRPPECGRSWALLPMEVPHRVLCTQVLMLGKEIPDLTVTQFSHLQSGDNVRVSGMTPWSQP